MIATGQDTRTVDYQLKFSSASPFNIQSDFEGFNHFYQHRSLDELLRWSLSTFGDKVAQVSSFGPTGMVILDHLARLSPGIRVITLDTNFLFEETYSLLGEVQRRYPVQLDIRRPSLTPELQAETYGSDLWQTNPDQCCHLRKVVPLRETLSELEAWLTGLRRDQTPTRADLPLIMWDSKYELVKINPLAYWTRSRVWGYVLEHKIPYNPLHDQGYTSIGCTHCTHPAVDPNDERSGRWQGFQKVECGIHQPGGIS